MRQEFNVDPSFINLNSGTQSLCPQSTLELITRIQRDYESNPSFNMDKAWQDLWTINAAMAQFFNGSPASFFLRNNVTEALNVLIFGFPLTPGDEILASNLEYGAITNICRLRAQRENLVFRQAVIPVRRDGDYDAPPPATLVDAIVSQFSSSTKMLVLSHILTGTGQILPLQAIAKETRRRGIVLVVDGAQAPGSIPVDFSDLEDVDAYGGNLHKWMMGPKGTGFGWVPRRHHDRLQTAGGGWNTFENFVPGPNFANDNRFFHEFLPQGCQDFSRYLALKDTFDFWHRHTQAAIHARLHHLQQLSISHARDFLKFPVLSAILQGPVSSPLLAFELPEKLRHVRPPLLRDQIFNETKVLVSTPLVDGRTVLRLSPHIYNSDDEVAIGIERLGRFFGMGA